MIWHCTESLTAERYKTLRVILGILIGNSITVHGLKIEIGKLRFVEMKRISNF